MIDIFYTSLYNCKIKVQRFGNNSILHIFYSYITCTLQTDSYLVPVTQLEAITNSMELLARNGQIPDWVVARCKPLLHRLSVCLESR